MQPYKRKPRSGGSMVVLGGWLFADLLLGLAMLFAVATTVGAPPPTPTPPATPNLLATSEANYAQAQIDNDATVAALQNQIADSDLNAQQTEDRANARATAAANAEATRAAQSESERATADAQSTQDAIVAQATIEALSTEQAAAAANSGDLNSQLATTEALATENASSGVDSQGTIEALQNQIAASDDSLATSQAQVANAQSTADASQQQQIDANATSVALQEQVAGSSLNPVSVQESVQVDLNGVVAGNANAEDDARDELDDVMAKYVNGDNCHIGFALISSRSTELGQGVQLSDAMATLIETEFPELMPISEGGGTGQLISESIALPGTTPVGEVQLQLFFNVGCQPTG